MANPNVVAMLKRRRWKIVKVNEEWFVVPKQWTSDDFHISNNRIKEYNDDKR